MKKINFGLVAVLLGLVFATPSSAFAGSEVHITSDGKATVSQVKVMQIFGSTLATRMYWGNAFVRMTVKTDKKTAFLRATGEATTLSEIVEGNVLDIVGELEYGSDSLVVVASSVKNVSVEKAQATFSGKVTSVDLSARKFSLDGKQTGLIAVTVSSATQFVKGNRTLDLEHLKVGDNITKVSGEFDYKTKILTATSVNTYLDLNIFKPRNFEGTVAEVFGTTLPASLKVKIEGVTYTINLGAKASVLRKNKSTVGLNRFVSGDPVRLYGSIREVDDPVIDAEIIRNLDL